MLRESDFYSSKYHLETYGLQTYVSNLHSDLHSHRLDTSA